MKELHRFDILIKENIRDEMIEKNKKYKFFKIVYNIIYTFFNINIYYFIS